MVDEQQKQQFEWDPDKNASNKRKHGIDFRQATGIFDRAHLTEPIDEYHGELRERTLGQVPFKGALSVIHTARGSRTRIISARKARKSEVKRFNAYLKRTVG